MNVAGLRGGGRILPPARSPALRDFPDDGHVRSPLRYTLIKKRYREGESLADISRLCFMVWGLVL